MARKLSAEKLTDQATDLISQIKDAATAEAREYLAKRLARMASGTAAADKEIADCTEGAQREITEEFRAGMAFAAELLADRNFDF